MLGDKVSPLFSHLDLFGGWGTGITGSEELGERIPPNMIAMPNLANSSVLQKENFAVNLIN